MLLLSLQLLGPLLSLLELRLQSVGLLLLLGVGIRQRADLRAKSTQLLLLLGQRFGLNLGLLRLGGGGLNRAVGGLVSCWLSATLRASRTDKFCRSSCNSAAWTRCSSD